MNRTARLRRWLIVATVLGGTVQLACKDPGPQIGPPATITKLGDAQLGAAGAELPIDPGVVILDASGKGVPGIAVTFVVTTGGGSLVGGSATTDAQGTAKVTSWTLGQTVGGNTITASAAGVPGSPVTFSAVATAGPAATITKFSTDPPTAPVGGSIDSIMVRIQDQFGNPVSGETVVFAATAGGGSVSPTSRVTLADGRAAAQWTIGPTVGALNTATATRAGIASPTVTFTTTGANPVSAVRFASRILIVDSSGTLTPVVGVFDQNGNAIAGSTVSLTARAPTIATAGTSSVTGVRTGQTFLIATSVDNPAVRDSALLIVGNVASPVVTASVPRFDLKADTTFTVSIVIDMRGSTEKLGATTLQLTWNTAMMTYVSETEGASGAGATLNTSNTATGVLTMALASSAGLSGAIEVRRITFRASATAGRSGSFAVNVIDLAAAATFSNLAPKTVSGTYPLRTR